VEYHFGAFAISEGEFVEAVMSPPVPATQTLGTDWPVGRAGSPTSGCDSCRFSERLFGLKLLLALIVSDAEMFIVGSVVLIFGVNRRLFRCRCACVLASPWMRSHMSSRSHATASAVYVACA